MYKTVNLHELGLTPILTLNKNQAAMQKMHSK